MKLANSHYNNIPPNY